MLSTKVFMSFQYCVVSKWTSVSFLMISVQPILGYQSCLILLLTHTHTHTHTHKVETLYWPRKRAHYIFPKLSIYLLPLYLSSSLTVPLLWSGCGKRCCCCYHFGINQGAFESCARAFAWSCMALFSAAPSLEAPCSSSIWYDEMFHTTIGYHNSQLQLLPEISAVAVARAGELLLTLVGQLDERIRGATRCGALRRCRFQNQKSEWDRDRERESILCTNNSKLSSL